MKNHEKKEIKNYILKLIPILLLILVPSVQAKTLPITFEPKDEFNTKVYNANEWDTFKTRTKEEIGAKYDQVELTGPTYVNGDSSTYYVTPASPTSPYYQGVLTQDTLNIMTAEANFYRWLIGGYKEFKSVPTNNDTLQIGALARNISTDHEIKDSDRPSDFPLDLWNKAADVDHNILAWGYTPRYAIPGWISEGYYDGAFDTVGHRAAIIDPLITDLDLGYSGRTAIGKINKGGTTGNEDVPYGALPAPGYMPIDRIYASESAWSIILNSSIIKTNGTKNVIVTVTNLDTNNSYECTYDNGSLIVINPLYASPFIVFKQPNYKVGEKYQIEVTGLVDVKTGSPAIIRYTTELFSLKDYTSAKVKSVSLSDGVSKLEISSDASTQEKLEAIAKILPKTVTVNTDTGRNTTLDVSGDWKVEDGKFVNKVDKSKLPSYITDPNKILDNNIEVKYSVELAGWFTMRPSTVKEGESVSFNIRKYVSNTSTVLLYQVKNNNSVVTRYNENTSVLSNPYRIDSATIDDAGTYIGAYTFWGTLYITGVEKLTVKSDQKIDPEYDVPTGLTATYGDKLSDIELPKGFTWDDETASVGNVGEHKFYVTYTPDDTSEYNIVKNIEVTVTVVEKELTQPTIENTTFTYNFNEQSITLKNLDTKTMKVSGTQKETAAGNYEVVVSLKDKTNYKWSSKTREVANKDDITLTWTINKLDKVTVTVTGNTKSVVYDGEEKKVEGYTYKSSNSSYTDKDFTFNGNKTAKGTNIGTYYMNLSKDDFTNTNKNIETVEFVVTDGYLKITAKEEVTIKGLTYTSKDYDGKKVTPEGTLKVEGNKVAVEDLEVTYYKKVNQEYVEVSENEMTTAGEYRVTYEVPSTNKQYSGSVTYDFEIRKIKVNKPTIVNPHNTYNRQQQEVKFNNYDSKTMNMTGTTTGTNANIYQVVVSLKDQVNYSWNDGNSNDLTLTWTIDKVTGVKVIVTGNTKKAVYDGEEKSVEGYTYKVSNDLYLEEDFEFTGVASATGTELGKYPMNLKSTDFQNKNNNFEVEFEVTDGYLEISEKEVVEFSGLTYPDKTYTGEKYVPEGELKVSNSEVTLEDIEVFYEGVGDTVYSSTDAPTKAGTYRVTYKVKDTVEFYTGSKTYDFKITKAIPQVTPPTGYEVERNTSLSDIELPSGFAWKQDEVLTPGTHKFMAVYTPTDLENYEVVDNIEIEVVVKDYRIVEDNLTYTLEDDTTLEFNVVAENNSIESIYVNDELLTEEDYVIENKKVILKEEYMNSLEEGSYTLRVVLSDHEEIIDKFTIGKHVVQDRVDTDNPYTNDNILISIILLIISFITIIFAVKKSLN